MPTLEDRVINIENTYCKKEELKQLSDKFIDKTTIKIFLGGASFAILVIFGVVATNPEFIVKFFLDKAAAQVIEETVKYIKESRIKVEIYKQKIEEIYNRSVYAEEKIQSALEKSSEIERIYNDIVKTDLKTTDKLCTNDSGLSSITVVSNGKPFLVSIGGFFDNNQRASLKIIGPSCQKTGSTETTETTNIIIDTNQSLSVGDAKIFDCFSVDGKEKISYYLHLSKIVVNTDKCIEFSIKKIP